MGKISISKKASKIKWWKISPQATNIKGLSEPELTNCVLDFKSYISGKCWIDEITTTSEWLKALKILKSISQWRPQDIRPKDTVEWNWKYKWLYQWLAPDIKVKEIDFSRSGRIFYYNIRNTIYILWIKWNHINI